MKTVYRLITLLIIAFMTAQPGHGTQPNGSEPDFAFPRTVATDAEEALRHADLSSNAAAASAQRLRAVLELCRAQQEIDPDTVMEQPALVASLAERSGAFAPGEAMLTLLQARLLYNIYSANRFVYDRVSAPAEPLPPQVAQWSGSQFKAQIRGLIERALALAGSQPQALTLYDTSLEGSTLGMEYMPTVYDFVAYRGAEIMNYIGDDERSDSIKNAALAAAAPASPAFFFWTAKKEENLSALLDVYDRYAGVEAARYLLLEDAPEYDYGDDAAALQLHVRYVDALRASLQAFPNWEGNPVLQRKLSYLTRPELRVSIDNYVGAGTDAKVTGTYEWADRVRVDVYVSDSPRGARESIEHYIARASRLMTYTKVIDEANRCRGQVEFTVPTPERHCYLALRAVMNSTVESLRLVEAEVVPLMAFSVQGNNSKGLVTVDFTTGKPLAGVTIVENTFSFRTDESNAVTLGTTDSRGVLLYSPRTISGRKSRYLSARYRGQNYDFERNFQVSNPFDISSGDNTDLSVLVDRPLYHPGDSVAWAVMAVRHNGNGGGSTIGGNATVKFYDANSQLIDSVSVTLDGMGRANGTFAIPRGRLDGTFRIEFTVGDHIADGVLEVSDFRMPVFEVEVTRTERDVPSAGAVRLTGKAVSYAGMALGGIRISAEVKTAVRWWRGLAPQNTLGTVEAVTAADGAFVLDIPAALLADADGYTDFCANITATSPAGEAAFATAPFTTGKPYVLRVESPRGNVNTDNGVSLLVKALDMQGDNMPIAVNWKLCGAADTTAVAHGSVTAGTPVALTLDDVAPGRYRFFLEPADSVLASAAVGDEVTIYSVRRRAVPPVDGFFLPSANTYAGEKIKVGVSRATAWLYAVWADSDGRVTVDTHRVDCGFSDIPVPGTAASMLIITVDNGKTVAESVNIEHRAATLGIVAETFRDRLTPGTDETWRFRIANGDGSAAAGAAMVARMYNRALDALADGSVPQPFHAVFTRPFLSYSMLHIYPDAIAVFGAIPRFADVPVEEPAFRYITENMVLFRGVAMSRAYAAGAPAEEALYDAEVTMDAAPAMGAAPEMKNSMVADFTAERDEVEEAVSADEGAATPEKIKYRSSEVLQAFFEPTLTADADGNVDIVFTVPDANASWTFQALAWNSDALGAAYAGTAVSSKPVMVQPNMPRYLRQGDRARLLTTVYNNTDAPAAITTVVEIFDLADGTVKDTVTSTDTIAAGASAIVAIDVEAPTDAPSIGFRARATDGTFADGEQSAIPVLTSAATVIESTEFYLNPDTQEPFTVELDMTPGFTYTLQYCDNPIWTVVKALRGTRGRLTEFSNGLAAYIFSLMAGGIIADSNPAVGVVVEQWKNSNGGAALTSMLARNEDLKLMMLEATPWLQTADDENARMASLAQLFDASARSLHLDKAMDDLRALQNADGGFAWASWSGESSVWSTRSVLVTFGIARSLGVTVDDDAHAMLRRALDYVCSQATQPHHPSTDATLALLAALYPEYRMPSAAAALVAATRTGIERTWRDDDTADKAWDIITLGADNATSAQIMASLRQFGVVRPGMGMCFPSVDDIRSYATIMQAYKLMGADRRELDAMRQWVIVQAQANDDLTAFNPDYVISALMTTGTDWSRVGPVANITLDGTTLVPPATDAGSGYFAMPLQGEGRCLSIGGNGVTPAYGSVTGIGRRPATTVAARPGRDLSIVKRVLVNRGGEWVETDSLVLGERARVQLTIVSRRDMEYVAVTDERPASFAPVDQLPGYVYSGGLGFYRVNADAATNLFIGYLPAGTYHIEYDMTAAVAGNFISGIATLQSQYDPALTAHSAGNILTVQ